MKKILVATNFSRHSRHTIEYILELMEATQIPCQICLLNTYIVQHHDSSKLISLNDELKSVSRAGLERERSEMLMKVNNSKLILEIASHMGSLHNVVLQMVQKDKFDLVAMGKSDGDNVETISKMLRQQKCPLLITYLSDESTA